MGVDIVWFLPIHPIGKLHRKGNNGGAQMHLNVTIGSQGSPYSIADYRAVNPEYGTKSEFVNLIKSAHDIGLKIMIDVVLNHTAHDSVLAATHPEWFLKDENGKPKAKVPSWSDIVDLDYSHKGNFFLEFTFFKLNF